MAISNPVLSAEVVYRLYPTVRHNVNTVFIDDLQTLLPVGFHAAPPPFGTAFPHLYALLTASLVLGRSSRLTMFASHL